MANGTESVERSRLFVDNLQSLFTDCLSEDPESVLACRVSSAVGVTASVILPIFLLAGFFGNGMTAYIYLWKLRPLTRQGVYFAAVAIADNCGLFVSGFLWMFLAKGLPWISGARIGYFVMNESEMACRLFRYFEPFVNLLSISLFLIMLVDRCLSVYFPFRFQRVSANSAIKACALAVAVDGAVTILFCLPFQWVTYGSYTVCGLTLTGWQLYSFVIFIFMIYSPSVVLMLGIFVTNGFLIFKVRRIASQQAEIRAGSHGDSVLTSTVICITISVILIVTSFPFVAFSFGNILTTLGMETDLSNSFYTQKVFYAFYDIGRMLQMCNQSVNWIVLLWKSAQFRQTFLSSLCVCRRQAASGHQMGQRLQLNADRAAANGGNIQLK